MSNDTPKTRLEKLFLERDAKFDEIVSCLSRELYSDVEDRNCLMEEAEVLTDSFGQLHCQFREADSCRIARAL